MFKGIKNVVRVVIFGALILALALGARLIGGKKALADAPSSSSSSSSSSSGDGGDGGDGGSGGSGSGSGGDGSGDDS
ncbi:MAG TPA: hypothetical protein VJK04_03830 [Candidatus Paceibacterota bacterium]